MTDVYGQGVKGEQMALELLKRKGYRLMAARYRHGRGEIDLVMKHGTVFVFVEVKYRTTGVRGDGLLAVTKSKQSRLRSTAMWYAVQNGVSDALMRFDVIEISPEGIIHVENAF
jgi:putative endonuclease